MRSLCDRFDVILLVDEVRKRVKQQVAALNATGLGCTRDKVDYKLGSVRNRGVRLVCKFELSGTIRLQFMRSMLAETPASRRATPLKWPPTTWSEAMHRPASSA